MKWVLVGVGGAVAVVGGAVAGLVVLTAAKGIGVPCVRNDECECGSCAFTSDKAKTLRRLGVKVPDPICAPDCRGAPDQPGGTSSHGKAPCPQGYVCAWDDTSGAQCEKWTDDWNRRVREERKRRYPNMTDEDCLNYGCRVDDIVPSASDCLDWFGVCLPRTLAAREPPKQTLADAGPAAQPPAPSAQENDIHIRGELDETAVRRAVRRGMATITACYERGKGRSGTVVARLSVDATGTVTRVAIEADSLGALEVNACIQGRTSRWRFPRPKGGIAEVSVPFVFAASR